MELHGLLPLLHDDLPHPLWGVDRAPLGLHEDTEACGLLSILVITVIIIIVIVIIVIVFIMMPSAIAFIGFVLHLSFFFGARHRFVDSDWITNISPSHLKVKTMMINNGLKLVCLKLHARLEAAGWFRCQ